MGELVDVFVSVLFSGAITLTSSLMFMLIRKLRGLGLSYGTDLFAVLLAADISVALGAVEAWRLGRLITSEQFFRITSVLLGILTIAACWRALTYEKSANVAFAEAGRQSTLRSRRAHLRKRYLSSYARAYAVRWFIGTLHLWWIARVPRWTLL